MRTDSVLAEQKIDLTTCDKEPIHIPGSIQPHGVLIVVKEPELTVIQVSMNTAQPFGIAPETLLGQPLAQLLGPAETQRLQTEILSQDLDGTPHYLSAVPLGPHQVLFERIVHRHLGQLIFEFEPCPHDADSALTLYPVLKSALTRLQRTGSVGEFCQLAAEEIKRFTDFDRVMVYKFLEDGAGRVIGEALTDGLEPYLGLHYPAADIPQQARALYLKSWLRFKVDVADQSTPLLPLINPVSQTPLDLSYAVLRAMSPVHTEYLKNIGATATLSLSIIQDGNLWGLIACHHHSGPKYVPHDRRMACEILAHTLSLQLASKEAAENYGDVARLSTQHSAFVEAMSTTQDYHNGLLSVEADLVTWLDAGGVAVCDNSGVHVFGNTPAVERIVKLNEWLTNTIVDDVYATDQLSQAYDEFADCVLTAAGLLALRLGKCEPHYILWFRPEQSQSVQWAGDPSKPVTVGKLGERLTPRKSFALWVEQATGRSAPWQAREVEAVRALHRSIYKIIVRNSEELQRLNVELERSNLELDSFAYIASHDLKEPLRGIHNYSHFLLEDYAAKLDEEGIAKLQTLIRLTQRMESLIDSLMYYSRLGRAELDLRKVSLQRVVEDTLETLAPRLNAGNIEIRMPRPLPNVWASPSRIGEVFANLITNAIKYNDKPHKWVEIGYTQDLDQSGQDTQIVLYVRDNGIGIPAQQHENIFRIFKRLHGRDDYGGGVGAGLTIVHKLIERHGGRIWIDSTPGEGSIFYFTLGATA